jgi:DNA-binding response OmpR family regulator
MNTVLLIEPDKVLAGTYSSALQEGGFKVILAAGAQQAVNISDKNRPDLVILELQLIEHSGFEFLYEFRSYQDWQNIPVIILSSVPMSEFEDNWLLIQRELGVVDYLYKPTTSLIKLIDKAHQEIKQTAQ